jgi:transcriptional antiterminator RfaH
LTRGPPLVSCILATTKPNSELEAAENLSAQGFDVFLPMTRTEVVDHRRRVVQRSRPLFPGYIFVWFCSRWRAVLSTRGVSGVVSMSRDDDGDRVPSAISDSTMSSLVGDVLSSMDDDGFVRLPPRFAPGQVLRVLRGPWEGTEVVLRANDALGRVCCLLRMLGREIERTFYERNLELACA